MNRPDDDAALGQEPGDRTAAVVARLSAEGFPTGAVPGGDDQSLVQGPVVGESAGRPDHHADPDDLIVAVGRGLGLLHDVPTAALEAGSDGLVVEWGREPILDRCRRRVESGALDGAELPYPYNQYRPDELLNMFVDGRPEREDLVCCHGAAVIDRFIVNDGTFSGFDRLDSVIVADRHFDLAVLHRSVQDLLGPEAVFRLYDAYGADPDLVRLDHYILASHLLGSLRTEPEDGRDIDDGEQVSS